METKEMTTPPIPPNCEWPNAYTVTPTDLLERICKTIRCASREVSDTDDMAQIYGELAELCREHKGRCFCGCHISEINDALEAEADAQQRNEAQYQHDIDMSEGR